MTSAGEQSQQRIGKHVATRRRQLGLTQTAAAQAADLARGTWVSLEAGTRETLSHQYAAIERALQWEPGSIEAIRDGRDPTPLPPDAARRAQLADVEGELRAIRDNPYRSSYLREWARTQLDQIAAIRAADQAEEAARRNAAG